MTEKVSILFYPGGGLGDAVTSLPVMAAVHEYFGENSEIDITTGQNIEALAEIYHGIPFIHQIFPNPPGTEFVLGESYDLLVVANEQVLVQIKEKAQVAAPDFVKLALEGLEKRKVFGVANHVHNMANNQLGNHAVLLGLDRRSLPLYTLGMPNYLGNVPAMQLRPGALAVLGNYGLSASEYITVQDGWDANFPLNKPDGRPTKVWSTAAWAELVAEIRRRHPDKKIVQLGSLKTGADIAGVDLNLRGTISLRDALALLKYAALHIDTEGGLVHMAHALNTQSLVLFGPTNEKFFGYPDNKNLVPPCNNCWWLTDHWMSECVRGLEVPECMTHHKPVAVADAVSECLAARSPVSATASFSAPPAPPSDKSIIGVAGNAALAAQLAGAGHHVTHFDLSAQKNVQRPIGDMGYKHFLARPGNLPVKNQTLDQLYFTAHENNDEFAGELLEALRVLKPGGHAVIQAAGADIASAFAKAKLPTPAGTGNTILLVRA